MNSFVEIAKLEYIKSKSCDGPPKLKAEVGRYYIKHMKKSKTQELDFIISDEIKTVGELGIQKITKILNAIYNLMII